jgi:hypothetical protein
MRMRVMGLEEVYEGVLKVTLGSKGHKGFNNKFLMYIPSDEVDPQWPHRQWPYRSEVDVIVGPVAEEPAPELALMEHAGESAEERDRG